MKRHLLLPIIGCVILFTGCIGTHYTEVESPSTLKYLYDESEENLSNMAKRYGSTLSKTVKESTPKPGACAEYAVMLAKLNKAEDANKWFNKETEFYPVSVPHVNYLKKTLIPEFSDDTVAYNLEILKKELLPPIDTTKHVKDTTPKVSFGEKAKKTWSNITEKFSKKDEEKAEVAGENQPAKEAKAKDKKAKKEKATEENNGQEKVKAPKEKKEKVAKDKQEKVAKDSKTKSTKSQGKKSSSKKKSTKKR